MKFHNKKTVLSCAGMFFAASLAVHADILYSNAATDLGNSLSFVNGQTLGNEIIMGGASPFDSVSSFSFEIYSPNSTFSGFPNVQMEVFLYENNGALVNGYPSPGSSLYDSGQFTLLTPQQYSVGFPGGPFNAVSLSFDLSASPVTVPQDFTLAAVVTGLAGGDTVGMELFNPATVGSNYNDYWLNNGGWELLTNGVSSSNFGIVVQGTAVPEPSSVSLGVIGATLLTGIIWLRRRQEQLKRG